jgi:hypothetical protein
MSASEYLQAIGIEQIQDPIGTPDIEINLAATNSGLQIEFLSTANNQRHRVTRTWEEIYPDLDRPHFSHCGRDHCQEEVASCIVLDYCHAAYASAIPRASCATRSASSAGVTARTPGPRNG